MTKARARCSKCREWFQFNIKKDKAVCPFCEYTNDVVAKVGFFKKDDSEYFRRT